MVAAANNPIPNPATVRVNGFSTFLISENGRSPPFASGEELDTR